MALDQQKVVRQLAELQRYEALSRQVENGLRSYRSALNTACSAREITYFNKTIDALSKKQRQLADRLEELQEEISRAAEEIAAEEATAEEAAAQKGAVV